MFSEARPAPQEMIQDHAKTAPRPLRTLQFRPNCNLRRPKTFPETPQDPYENCPKTVQDGPVPPQNRPMTVQDGSAPGIPFRPRGPRVAVHKNPMVASRTPNSPRAPSEPIRPNTKEPVGARAPSGRRCGQRLKISEQRLTSQFICSDTMCIASARQVVQWLERCWSSLSPRAISVGLGGWE